MISHNFDQTILRAYDIRGVVDKTLYPDDAYFIGLGFTTLLQKELKKSKVTITVGFDGRISSPIMRDRLIQGINDAGGDVINIGLGPTPQLYFSVYELGSDGGIMITGSHNPKEYNGFKMLFSKRGFFGEDIKKLGELVAQGIEIDKTNKGGVSEADISKKYIERISSEIKLPKKLKVVWDCGHGSTADIVTELCDKLTEKFGFENILLYNTIDGNFPAHHPDPTVEKNLEDLKKTVLKEGADLGIAFDGDGDRIGIIDSKARVMWGDQIMVVLSRSLLAENPGATIIADVKASNGLFDEIEKLGGKAIMWKTGHSLIKSKMIEEQALLAGEMSGHIFYKHKYYGFDDAIYVAMRFLEIVTNHKDSLVEIYDSIPQKFSTAEIRVEVREEDKFRIIDQIKSSLNERSEKFCDIDGVRWSDGNGGWWIIRASNTQNDITMRCESTSEGGLESIEKDMMSTLNEARSSLI